MGIISLAAVPAIIVFVGIYGLYRKVDVYGGMLAGAMDGMKILLDILPSMVALLTAIYMLRASGTLEIISKIIAPVTEFFGIPAECAPMGIVRPFSGSAALAAGTELIKNYGADSFIGRIASVMLGSAETTFYTIAVYFGAIRIAKTRYAIPAALIADFAGYIGSAIAVRLFF